MVNYLKYITGSERASAQYKVNQFIVGCTAFKIGKTGQTKEDRLSQYGSEYNEIEFVFSGSKREVDDMESFLIDAYSIHSKCDNSKDGEQSNNDSMKEDAQEYHVYVVKK